LNNTKTYHIADSANTDLKSSKLKDYLLLVKMRLSLTVVFTSLLGYLIAAGSQFSIHNFVMLALGGFLVTASANALNQVLEREYDINMTRTANRPVTSGRMKSSEAVLFAGLSCLLGITLLSSFNAVTAFLGMLSLICYAFVYTPMKRYSTFAVAVGAIPGALPVMIGITAFEGGITPLALILFSIQFLWQFPHFWAIGYISFEDYQKAGYKLLPSSQGEIDRSLGKYATLYALFILPLVWFLYYFGIIQFTNFIFIALLSLFYAVLSYGFHLNFDRKSAFRLMFFSFFYLPLVLLIIYFN